MKSTSENLKEAFAGESMANRKYLAFAKQAEKDGFKNVATLFRATAEAETIHALAHFNAMDGVKSTLENLEYAINGETYETNEMFKWAMEVERVHAELYKIAMEAVRTGKDIDSEVWLCPICGHLEFKNPPEKCPVCGVPGTKYEKIS